MILENDPVDFDLSSSQQKKLPLGFKEIVPKLHKNYLYWLHLRDGLQPTQPTFYRYLKSGITQAVNKIRETDNTTEEKIFLILETKIALMTINALILASEDYLKASQLQDAKECVDTAVSTLYELIKTREKLEPSLEEAVKSIREDIQNELESYQYFSGLTNKVIELKASYLLKEAKFYVIRHQLEKLEETLILLSPNTQKTSRNDAVDKEKLDALMTRLMFATVDESIYIGIVRHQYEVRNVTFSPDETYLATTSDDHTVKLIEVATGREITTIRHQYEVKNVTFSPDETYLATASNDNTAKLIEVATGREITTIRHQYGVRNVTFSPDGTYLATASNDHTAKLIEVATGREITTIQHQNRVENVTFSPDGTYLATASQDKTAKLIEVATGREITTIRHQKRVYSVTFSPDGTYLATASMNDKTAKLIEVATGREITTIQHQDGVIKVTFSPDGTYLVTASDDNTAKLIEVATGREITSIQHQKQVKNVTFSPDGTYLATASSDKTAKLINVQKLSQLLKEKTQQNPIPQPQSSEIVHLDKPEAFFLGWLRLESNQYSFYEYMLKEAQQQKEGLSVKYASPILETNLLLQSLGFLFLNAEKHYQTVYPTLININDSEIQSIAMQDMKQSISAVLSSLYELIAGRMKLDNEDYAQGIQSLKKEIEQKIENTELLLNIRHKLHSILQLEGIKNKGELQSIKEMLIEIDKIFKSLLPEEIKVHESNKPVISLKKDLEKQEISKIVNETSELQIIPLLSNLKELGLLNPAITLACLDKISPKNITSFCQILPQEVIDKQIALACLDQISPQEIMEFCQFLPQKVINQKVAVAMINKRRKTHYIGTLSPSINIANKETLLKILQAAPLKTWWLR